MTDWNWLNENTRLFLSRGYLSEGETPEERYEAIAMEAERRLGMPGFAKRFLSHLAKGWISLSSPIISNYGTKRGLPISCFGSFVGDSIEEIGYKAFEVQQMTKAGGGTSGYFGKIRHRGAPVSTGGYTDGPVHFMEQYQTVIRVTNQGDVRRGAFAAYLDVEHPDVLEYLNIREEGNVLQHISFGVCISDAWLESMLAGDKEKQSIWRKILVKRYETGYPYIFFTDNVNNNKPEVYKEHNLKIHASNLCVHGDTKILTRQGYQTISDLEGKDVEVWNGKEWSLTTVNKTGTNKKLFKVVTDCGHELICTPEHKFYIQETLTPSGHAISNGEIYEVRASDLVKGMKLIKFDLPVIEGEKELISPYTNGFFTGDGCRFENANIIYLYGDKKKLADGAFDAELKWNDEPNNKRMVCSNAKGLKPKFFVPDTSYSVKSRLAWLSGLLDADGTVARDGKSQTIQLGSVNKDFLIQVQLMLQTLGCATKVTFARPEGYYDLPANDKTGRLKKYKCKEVNRLLIAGVEIQRLLQLGLNCKRLCISNHQPNRSASRFVKILEVSEYEGLHDTFCFNEPKRHMGVFNGILTGQCSEICLPTDEESSFVCDLASQNLLFYEDWKDTEVVRDLVFFLDTVISEFVEKARGKRGFEAAVKFAEEHRALGIGGLGWHSYLQSHMIPFESMEAKLKNVEIWKKIKSEAEAASKELAQIFGEPKYGGGKRNSTLMAIAPTTSSAFILGQVSPSIEPLPDNYHVKDLQKGKFTYKNPYLERLLEEKGKNTEEVWREILLSGGSVQGLDFLSEEEKAVFKTFDEISPKEIIIQAAARQKYIDQSQSLNLKIHPDTPLKEVSNLLIEAWRLGVKTLYYQRSTNLAQKEVRNILSCASCEA